MCQRKKGIMLITCAFTVPKFTRLFEAVALKPPPLIVTSDPTGEAKGVKPVTIGLSKNINSGEE